ncbi:NAD(P)/FAD-dependent oxidoreductase [Phanerochaete sordida]|uniref:NAD(P)/FAD-dependent oxidoreductase n=1 Tax=Phanerochaete sordida TaxID=48140 RepID=A0A9P3LK72_9APHY|nr:NAD(P)/FAD-dependent oxidoreductase [Phanerochaete sordida]
MPLVHDTDAVAEAWLSTFARAVEGADAQGVAGTFLAGGWLRDVLTFSWDTRSLRGRDAIARYLAADDRLSNTRLTNIVLETDPLFAPQLSLSPSGEQVGVEAGFTYETRHCVGRGYAHLRRDADGAWRAVTVGMLVLDLKAHPEPQNVAADWEASGKTWAELERERKAKVETNPQVLIVGAGQCGLMTAARFRQMDIPALVIDKNERVGDGWRKRYKSLSLHTPHFYSPMLYQPFPSHWPVYAPRDKVADWFETYAVNQHLSVWKKSTFADRPRYDEAEGAWRVVVDHAGKLVELRPKHIVLATGTLGAPRMPDLPGRSNFQGVVMHAADFIEPAPFVGKRVVAVGAGNSSIDVCQDLATGGAASVTMVQRSQTVVVSRSSVREDLSRFWRPGEPVEVGDFKYSALPLGYFKEVNQSMTDTLWARETVLHEKLRKGGLKLHQGPENEGQFLMYFSRSGGYWLDKGGADLIADGRIKIKQGASPVSFTSNGLIFSDGSELAADAVIFATGYELIRSVNKRTFGEDIIDRTSEVWGFDEECEIQGCFRPTGHPGLWYAVGDFFNCRFMSKQLAILIKAAELGLYDVDKVQRGVFIKDPDGNTASKK